MKAPEPIPYDPSNPIRLKVESKLYEEIERREEVRLLQEKAKKMYVEGRFPSPEMPAGYDWVIKDLAEELQIPAPTLRGWIYRSPVKWSDLRRAYKARRNQEDENCISWYTEGLTWGEITALENSKKIQKVLESYFEKIFDENDRVRDDITIEPKVLSDILKINCENYKLIESITNKNNLGQPKSNQRLSKTDENERRKIREELQRKFKFSGGETSSTSE